MTDEKRLRGIFAKNLQYLLDRNGIDRFAFCEKTGLRYSTVSSWFNGGTFPRIDVLELIASTFNVSPSSLLEERHGNPTNNELTKKDEEQIARDLEEMLSSYDTAAAMKEGEPTEEDKELLRDALRHTMMLANRIAKQKFTPKKYRK